MDDLMIVPNILNSITSYNNQPTRVLNTDHVLGITPLITPVISVMSILYKMN
jgi:hypothetical protein